MMKEPITSSAIYSHFPFTPTKDQEEAVEGLVKFINDSNNRQMMMLTGYAGTGKTAILGALVKTLRENSQKVVLLAPTGRAAKVLSGYTGFPAYTVHKMIYRLVNDDDELHFALGKNKLKRALFIVDEVSMINSHPGPSEKHFGSGDLLTDLLTYIYSHTYCRVIFTGDEAQLPPVGQLKSHALDPEFIQLKFQLPVRYHILKEVMRQLNDSAILENATAIRKRIDSNDASIYPWRFNNKEVIPLNNYDLEEVLYSYFGRDSFDAIIITRSNKMANQYNQGIRQRIRGAEDEISAGDRMMVVKNNYYWLDADHPAGFIANGDMIEILKITSYTETGKYRFADVICRLIDYPDSSAIEMRLLLNTINSPGPSLDRESYMSLVHEVMASQYPGKHKTMGSLFKEDPYVNAVQVKFAYAVTCHKSQGGQWPVVIIDEGFINPDNRDRSHERWLYTACTRATERLYIVRRNR